MMMMMSEGSDMQSAGVSADKAEQTLTIVTQPHRSYSTSSWSLDEDEDLKDDHDGVDEDDVNDDDNYIGTIVLQRKISKSLGSCKITKKGHHEQDDWVIFPYVIFPYVVLLLCFLSWNSWDLWSQRCLCVNICFKTKLREWKKNYKQDVTRQLIFIQRQKISVWRLSVWRLQVWRCCWGKCLRWPEWALLQLGIMADISV